MNDNEVKAITVLAVTFLMFCFLLKSCDVEKAYITTQACPTCREKIKWGHE